MRKITILTAGVLCAVSLTTGAVANSVIKDIRAQLRQDFTIKIDGERTEFKNADGEVVYPILYDGTTYLPVRAIGEMMGKTVYWYEDDKLIELKKEKTTVTDADVIIGSGEKKPDTVVNDNKNNKNKNETPKSDKFDTKNFIGEEKAKDIALKKAGLTEGEVSFERIELDKDDNVWSYDVEFRKGTDEFEAEISAENGDIISWEVDNIN